ncbi:hybrid sensor histidine kinase/response regulator [Paraflavitalea soli]|uniref:histidine kinase n=1 Tax=Paraflavitalea soli TaxID=2315862 RepID=A0A3B7MHG3_9BACT|nr:hybrid sensor histidine kinase/response regulator transcription factor [Paraflavitalea soli]AXY72753.1 hybrid sensor histidine kinase/response regulator [Paraflavitalea soli]
MRSARLLACLLITSIFISPVTWAGGADPFFLQQYDNRNGLSNSAINYIYKDASNLLWIATWDGLNMYDGNTFHVFNYSKENDLKSIGSNVIRQVTEDKKGNIWVTTIEGISRYEKQSGRFYNYFYSQHQQGRVSEQEYALTTDAAGNVWCLDQKTGIHWYDAAIDSFRNPGNLLPQTPVSKLSFDEDNQLWALDANGGITVFSQADHRFRVVASVNSKAPAANLFRVGTELFFTTMDDQLYRLNTTSRTPEWIMALPHALSAITFYKQHYLLAWSTKGYGVYDQHFRSDDFLQQPTQELQDIRITSWAVGSEDILWYGTDGNGIIKVYPKTKSFGTIGTAGNGMPYNRAVRSFCEVNGELWVGTKGSGIMALKQFWKENNAAAQEYLTAPAALDNNSVYALTKGIDGLVYIGTDARGIGIYDPGSRKFYKWSDIKGTAAWPEFGSVYAIRQDDDLSLWLGTSGYGLVHLKIKRERSGQWSVAALERFLFNNSNTGPANDIIYALAEADNDQLWVGCRYGGLSLFDKKTRLFKTFKAFTYEGSLSNNDVLSLFKDSRNRLWVGTSYGLNWIDAEQAAGKEPRFRKLTTFNGLPNNTIHAITEDSTGQIWVSTNKGLARISPAGDQVAYYQQGDGLQSNEFSDGAVWKDREGRLFFGGTYGFNQFFPAGIRDTRWQPNLLLSGMLVGGKETALNGYQVLDTANNQPFHIDISRKDNFFELDMKAISFLNAEKCEYAWFLEGYDKAWHYNGTSGKIAYSNMGPGKYTLRVKWSNGEGNWSPETTLLTTTVLQYVLLRWYALAFYALVAACIFYIIYIYRKNKQEIRHQLEIEHRLREKDEAMHQSRIGFFTNIAHELQTPLTLIMGSVERFIDKANPDAGLKDKPYFLSLIHQQASRLTYLVQQLLEFRKGEAGFSNNQYSFIDISALLHNLAEPFLSLSEKNGMEYELSIQPGITGWMDKDKMEKIIFNLLSNAFKHSSKNEQVFFSAAENIQTKELEITVTNSCDTLSKEALDQLFEQFYVSRSATATTDKFGTGIGLAFTRQLVSLLKGRITVASTQGRITFKVCLPITPEEMENKSPLEVKVMSHQPSLLYRSVTTHPEPATALSATENNKQAILETLQTGSRQNILLVEDDTNIRFLVKDILKMDYIIHEAIDGLKALEQMELIMPDLIICDVMMPNMNGLDFCSRVKNAPATCHIPIIMLSARGAEDHHMEGYESGADAYMAKPFHAAHLQLRVRKMLEYRQKLVEVFKKGQTVQELEDAGLSGDDKTFLAKVIQIIEENLAEAELNALLLEKECNLSKMQLYRKLKTLTGMTPGEFIRLTRLRHAAALLVNTQLSVMEIFYRTGFNNQSYFFREFRKTYHCAPGEYREKRGVV